VRELFLETEQINSEFNNKLQNFTPETANKTIFYLGKPSYILLRAGIEDKSLKLAGNKLLKKIKKHGFKATDLMDLPNAIANPAAIFEGNRPGSFSVLTEIVIDGNNVIVIIEVGKGFDVKFNIITSVYGKAKRGIENWINEEKLIYYNKEKTLSYLSTLAPIASAKNNQGLEAKAPAHKYTKKSEKMVEKCLRGFSFLFFAFFLCFAEDNGFSYWWLSDGIIDYRQMEELNDLSGDVELWCALAELYAGKELAEEADCIFAQEAQAAPKPKKGKKTWSVNLKNGANLDSNGNFINKFAKISSKAWKISGNITVKENKTPAAIATFKHGFFYAKGGDLTSKHRGVLSEINVSEMHLGAQRLFRDGKDSSWFYGKFSKNFWDKRIYAGGNFRNNQNRTWQGVRFLDWNFRMTETSLLKESENTLDFAFLAERKKQGARLAFEHDKNKSRISAGFKPIVSGSDSLWARAENPLSTRLGWDKKTQNVKVSNSFYLKKNWNKDKPLEFRSESKIKLPLNSSPLLTARWTANVYRDGRLNLKQFYVEGAVGF